MYQIRTIWWMPNDFPSGTFKIALGWWGTSRSIAVVENSNSPPYFKSRLSESLGRRGKGGGRGGRKSSSPGLKPGARNSNWASFWVARAEAHYQEADWKQLEISLALPDCLQRGWRLHPLCHNAGPRVELSRKNFWLFSLLMLWVSQSSLLNIRYYHSLVL